MNVDNHVPFSFRDNDDVTKVGSNVFKTTATTPRNSLQVVRIETGMVLAKESSEEDNGWITTILHPTIERRKFRLSAGLCGSSLPVTTPSDRYLSVGSVHVKVTAVGTLQRVGTPSEVSINKEMTGDVSRVVADIANHHIITRLVQVAHQPVEPFVAIAVPFSDTLG